MRELQLQDKIMLVDDDVFEKLESMTTKVRLVKMGSHHYAMVSNTMVHRIVMDAGAGNQIKHIDGNTLNNQRSNLMYKRTPKPGAPKQTDEERKAARVRATQRWSIKKYNKISPEDIDSPTYRLKMKRRKIVNVAIGDKGSWYPSGQKRLYDSVRSQGDTTDFMLVSDTPNLVSPYMRKINAIIDAYNDGAEQILYLDCSITAVRPLEDIWEYIETNGYYLYASGYNCAQTANDRCLKNFGITRDTAQTFHECASNVVGINVKHWAGQKIIRELMMKHIQESVLGDKWPDANQRYIESADDRFQFHRQDQTIFSIIAGIYKLKLEDHNHFVYRDEPGYGPVNDSVIFKLKGGI